MAAACIYQRVVRRVFENVRFLHLSPPFEKVVKINLTDIGDGIHKVKLKEWFVSKNDTVTQLDRLCELESDVVTVTIASRLNGRVIKLHSQVGDSVAVGRALLDIDVPDDIASVDIVSDMFSSGQPSVLKVSKKQYDVTAKEYESLPLNYETTQIKQLDQDVEQYTKESLSPNQKSMAKRMVQNLKIPILVFSDEIDVTNLVKFISEIKLAGDEKYTSVGYVPMFIKAISKGLLKYPILNSSYDENDGGQVIYKHYHNIGIAFDSPMGLLVPNIKHVQNLSVLEITQELKRLRDRSLQMKLSTSDLTGGTFTVSNIGSISGTSTTPTILPPEVCIAAFGKIQILPRFDCDGHIVAAHVMTISWTADHRLIDGATVARCSQVFRYYVENPQALLSESAEARL